MKTALEESPSVMNQFLETESRAPSGPSFYN